MPRSKSDVIEYVEIEADEEVVHAKQEQTFRDLGQTVNIWNVKTAKGAWWVIEGDYVPMNLYTQNATYLSADEAYSFHMGIIPILVEWFSDRRLSARATRRMNGNASAGIGIMWRLLTRQTGDPESILGHVSFGEKRFASSKRKLEEAAKACSQAEEVEQLQSVGLMCRESLIEIGKELVIESDLPEGAEMPKLADFKNRSRLAIDRLLDGSENNDLRSHSRKVCDAAWDFSSTMVHSSSRTKPEATICVSLTGAVLSLFENLFDKEEGPSPNECCPVCKSRRLQFSDSSEGHDAGQMLKVVCAHCGWGETYQLDDNAPEVRVE
jgi:hypothetical protein